MNYATMLQNVVKAVKEATQMDINPCINNEMAEAIQLWAAMYEGKEPWLSAKQGITSACIPPSLAAEVARLVTLEVKSKCSDPDVDAVYQRLIKNIRVPAEYGCALGGVVIKPYLTDDGVAIQYIRADRFFPIAFDASGNITQCVFVDQVRTGKSIYTRLELHILDSGLAVHNLAYKSQSDGVLGVPVNLGDVPQWAGIAEEATFLAAKKLPIGYFKIPFANTIDPDSPLGVSIYSRAVRLIAEADKKYSNICWEYEAKQAAVHIAESMLKSTPDGSHVYPGGKERLYRALEYNVGASDKPLLDVYSPDIRAEALYTGYQNQLKMIEFACGVSYGTISDPQVADKTATEVKASKQRLYATITDTQMSLQCALTDFADAVAFWLGKPPQEVTFVWDDSIVVDSEQLRRQKLLELQAGVIDEVQYHMDVYGMTEDGSIELVDKMRARKPAEPIVSDFITGGDG